MADPRDGHLAMTEFWECRLPVLAGPAGQQRFPDHFAKKRARIEMLGRGQVLECPRQWLLLARGPIRLRSMHITAQHPTDGGRANKIQFPQHPHFATTILMKVDSKKLEQQFKTFLRKKP